MTGKEEKVYVARALKGDEAAFEAIVTANERLLYSLALRMLGNREDAADAVQEAFFKAYTNLASYRGESKLSGWLCRIATNVCLDMLRARRDTVSLTAEDEAGGELEIEDERFDPMAVVERTDLRERVRAAVDRLPPDFKTPLLLREYGCLSYAEIAKELRLNEATVKTRIFRARKKLCVILTDDGNFSGKSPSNPSEPAEGGART